MFIDKKLWELVKQLEEDNIVQHRKIIECLIQIDNLKAQLWIEKDLYFQRPKWWQFWLW